MSDKNKPQINNTEYRVFSVYGLYLYLQTIFGQLQAGVYVDHPSVKLPPQVRAGYVEQGYIILTLDNKSCRNLSYDPYHDLISFNTRFNGVDAVVRFGSEAIFIFKDGITGETIRCPASDWEMRRADAKHAEPEPPREFSNTWEGPVTKAEDMVDKTPDPPKKGSHLRVVK